MVTFYVWYRVEADSPETETIVRHMQNRLACRSGVAGRLMKRCGDALQWLEVYENVREPAEFERKLMQAVDEFDLDMFCADRRHLECFIADTPPAQTCRV